MRREPQLELTRRDFGRLTVGGLAGLAASGLVRGARAAPGPGSADPSNPVATPAAAGRRSAMSPNELVSLVGVERGADASAVESAVRSAALGVTDFSWLSRGDSVCIKPVCNSGNEYPATTDPVALRAMIALLRERGAGRIVVADMSGVQFVRFTKDHLSGSTRTLMNQNAMAKTVTDADAELHAFEEQGWDAFHEEAAPGGEFWTEPVMMPDLLNEVDHVVLMPRCARHMLAGSTLGLKAAVGWWRHDSRLVYHREGASLPEKTAGANTVASLTDKQRLVLTSATKVMTSFGPDQGFVVEPSTGLVMASTSVVAHDMASLAWLLENRKETPAAHLDGMTKDPHRSDFARGAANRMVSGWLGGWREALSTTSPPESDATTIWDDKVLASAFAAFGGRPAVELADAEHSVPEPVMSSLTQALAG